MESLHEKIQIFDRRSFEEGKHLKLLKGALVLMDKPLDWSSFDVVKYFRIAVKRATGLRKIKIGHAGTLDPKATGLLLLCTGKATKIIEQLMDHDKEYLATLKLGATTPSYDTEYPEDTFYPTDHINQEAFCHALTRFEGDIMQVPPLFSAISIGGKRAYKLARKGRDITLPSKPITIHRLELLDFSHPQASIKVHCGRGTYIRSLARDIGEALGSGAYLTSLRRTKTGIFAVEDAFQMEELDKILLHADLEVDS